jgi:hypothetical protein
MIILLVEKLTWARSEWLDGVTHPVNLLQIAKQPVMGCETVLAVASSAH